jgi:hypothetical protein
MQKAQKPPGLIYCMPVIHARLPTKVGDPAARIAGKWVLTRIGRAGERHGKTFHRQECMQKARIKPGHCMLLHSELLTFLMKRPAHKALASPRLHIEYTIAGPKMCNGSFTKP